MYVPDTNTLIYFFKGMGNVAERLLSVPPKEIGISAIVLFELELGIAKSSSNKRRGQLGEMLASVSFLPFGEKEARSAASIRADLESKGTPIGPYDILIAGTALARQATLVTRNIGEFGRISGLSLENWF